MIIHIQYSVHILSKSDFRPAGNNESKQEDPDENASEPDQPSVVHPQFARGTWQNQRQYYRQHQQRMEDMRDWWMGYNLEQRLDADNSDTQVR